MRACSLARGGATLGLTFLLLTIVWLGLSPAGQASSLPESRGTPAPTASRTSPTPDPRWLTLIRSASPRTLNAPQAAAPSINIHLTDGMVAGRAPIAATVSITVARTGSQVAYATATPFPDESGFFYVAYLYGVSPFGGGGGYSGLLQAGDVVWVKQATAIVSMTVPALSGLADTNTDTVYGAAPMSQPVSVYVFPFAAPDTTYTRTVTADASGQYQAILTPTMDLRPRDSGYTAYAESADRRAYARFVAPFLRVQVNGVEVSGLAAPRSTVEITVMDAGGAPRIQLYAYADGSGSFLARYYQPAGWSQVRRLWQSGDRIVAAAAGQTFSMSVLPITAYPDVNHGQVWGTTVAGQPVEVVRQAGPLQWAYDDALWLPPAGQTVVTATTSGAYTASLLLAHADYGAATVTSADGHQTFVRFAVPYIWIQLGDIRYASYYLAWGQIDDLGTPVTVTIQGPSGYPKGVLNITSSDNGYFSMPGGYASSLPNPIVESGDLITLTSPRGVQISMTLPTLTARAYPVSDTIAGLAPPDSHVTLTIYAGYPVYSPRLPGAVLTPTPAPTPPPTPPLPPEGGYYTWRTFVVTATAQGDYTVDLGGVYDIIDNSEGKAEITTAEGYTVARIFSAIRSCQPLLLQVQVGGNLMTGLRSGPSCASAVLRLRDGHGQIKVTQTLYADYWNSYFSVGLYDYNNNRPIAIMPGDTIEIESPGQPASGANSTPTLTPRPTAIFGSASQPQTLTVTTLVPSLTVNLDAVANAITGLAPPLSPIDVTLPTGGYDWQRAYRRILADADGHYGLDTSDLRLVPNREGYVLITDQAGNTTQRNFSIHGLRFFMPIMTRN